MDLRRDHLEKFTDAPSFPERVDTLLEEIKKDLKWECKAFGDSMAFRGLPPLAVHCDRKAGRIYRRVMNDLGGRDDFQHDLDDLLRYAIYANLYYRMLKEKEE